MTRILVTGATGYIGAHLVEALCACDWVKLVVGLDIRGPSFEHERYRFVRRDIRESVEDLTREHGIQAVVHLAYVVAPVHNKRQMEDINVQGATNVLEACSAANVAHLLYTSSATVYGFHRDNEVPLTEESPLRANDDFTYAENKVRIEEMMQQFARDHRQTKVTVLRPCFVVGPGASHPLVTHLQKKLVPLPRHTPPYQFVHPWDLTQIILHFIAHPCNGVYNVAGDGTITFEEMLRMLGNFRLGSHWPVMYAVNHLAWLLRLTFITEVPSPALRMIRHPWLASAKKLRAETGYEFAYDSRGAFQDFAEAIGVRARIGPPRGRQWGPVNRPC